jgi:ATP/maltotriose-dependent transcriptional regulator MalT
MVSQGRLAEAEAAYTEAYTFARGFRDNALLYECLSPLADLQIMRGQVDQAESELEAVEKTHAPAVSIRVVYLLPTRIRAALARRDVDRARTLIREAELTLRQLPPETQAGLRGTLDAAISAAEAATSEPEWPLFNGYRREEFTPEQRKALGA